MGRQHLHKPPWRFVKAMDLHGEWTPRIHGDPWIHESSIIENPGRTPDLGSMGSGAIAIAKINEKLTEIIKKH